MRRIGLLVEGSMDEEIIPLLLHGILGLKAGHDSESQFVWFPYPPNGFGEIPKNLRRLIELYKDDAERRRIGCGLFVVVHDSRKTKGVQQEIRSILRQAPDFPAVYGMAIQEMEAWVLGDIENANRRVFKVMPSPKLPCPPEKDSNPKKTLTELFVRPSPAIEYDVWNRQCARLVAPHLRHEQVAIHCPRGFKRLSTDLKRKARRQTILPD